MVFVVRLLIYCVSVTIVLQIRRHYAVPSARCSLLLVYLLFCRFPHILPSFFAQNLANCLVNPSLFDCGTNSAAPPNCLALPPPPKYRFIHFVWLIHIVCVAACLAARVQMHTSILVCSPRFVYCLVLVSLIFCVAAPINESRFTDAFDVGVLLP